MTTTTKKCYTRLNTVCVLARLHRICYIIPADVGDDGDDVSSYLFLVTRDKR